MSELRARLIADTTAAGLLVSTNDAYAEGVRGRAEH